MYKLFAYNLNNIIISKIFHYMFVISAIRVTLSDLENLNSSSTWNHGTWNPVDLHLYPSLIFQAIIIPG